MLQGSRTESYHNITHWAHKSDTLRESLDVTDSREKDERKQRTRTREQSTETELEILKHKMLYRLNKEKNKVRFTEICSIF